MRVRVSYVAEVTDEYRRALRGWYGQEGLATRKELKEHFEQYGNTLDDDLLHQADQRRKAAAAGDSEDEG